MLMYANYTKNVGLWAFCVLQFFARAQKPELFSTSAYSASMGGVVAGVEGAAAVFTNGISLLSENKSTIIVNAELKWSSFEFQSVGLGFYKTHEQKNIWGVTLQKLGLESAHFLKMGVVYARGLSAENGLSAHFYYNTWRVVGYQNNDHISYAVAFKHKLSESITLGAQVWNPVRYRINRFETTSSQLNAYAQIQFNDFVRLIIENHFNFGIAPMGFSFGLAYAPMPVLVVRGGISSQPTYFTLGCAIKLSEKSKVEIGTPSFSVLGFSPAMSYSQDF